MGQGGVFSEKGRLLFQQFKKFVVISTFSGISLLFLPDVIEILATPSIAGCCVVQCGIAIPVCFIVLNPSGGFSE